MSQEAAADATAVVTEVMAQGIVNAFHTLMEIANDRDAEAQQRIEVCLILLDYGFAPPVSYERSAEADEVEEEETD